MAIPQYHLVFDVESASVWRFWPAFLFPLVVVVVSVVVLVVKGQLSKASAFRWWRLGLATSPGLLLAVVLGGKSYGELHRLRTASREGKTEYVEGTVERFEPMPMEGHRNEVFEVNGQRFEYSDFDLSPGFNNTRSHGGPIYEGRRVRIRYVGNFIVRLEVE